MNKDKGAPKNKFSHRGHLMDEALLFQFSLFEFLSCCKVLSEPFSRNLFQKLIGDLSQLSSPFLYSQRQTGVLLKLHYYLSLLEIYFPQRNSEKDPSFKLILETSEKAMCSAIGCQRLFEKNLQACSKQHKMLLRQTGKLKNLLAKRIFCYEKNENILFFLLRNQKDLALFWKKNLVKETFKIIFPEGVAKGIEWIKEQYILRKFSHLLPEITSQGSELLKNR